MSGDSLHTELASIGKFLHDGGYVMPALLAVGVLLWYFLALRYFSLRKGFEQPLIEYLKDGTNSGKGVFAQVVNTHSNSNTHDPDDVNLALLETDNRLDLYRKAIGALCAIAPLLGLLGTVSGMIETFASLVTMELFAQSGGVGGGIAEALISTQLGLAVAVPGVIASKLLHHREEKLRDELKAVWQAVKQHSSAELNHA